MNSSLLRGLLVTVFLPGSIISASAQTKYALLIAAGQFAPGSRYSNRALQAPPNDVRLMASVLRWRYGFSPGNITLVGLKDNALGGGYRYSDSRPTREAIYQGFQWLKRSAGADDYVTIYFSGHGTRVFNPSSPKPTLDSEALVTYEATRRSLILDDDIADWVKAIRTPHQTLIFDTCYSAGQAGQAPGGEETGDLEVEPVGKYFTLGLALSAPRESAGVTPQPKPYVLLASCGDRESAYEFKLRHKNDPTGDPTKRISVSAFTWALYQTLCWEARRLTCSDLIAHIRDRFKQPLFKSIRYIQTPQLKGGDRNALAIAPPAWKAERPRIPLIDTASAEPRMEVGELAGVQPGMTFLGDVAGSGIAPAQAPKLTVSRTDWFVSSLHLLQGHPPLPPFAVPIFLP